MHSIRNPASAVRLYDDTWPLDFHSDHFEMCKTIKSLCYTPENNTIPSQFYFNKNNFYTFSVGVNHQKDWETKRFLQLVLGGNELGDWSKSQGISLASLKDAC